MCATVRVGAHRVLSFSNQPLAWRWAAAILLGAVGVLAIVLINRKAAARGSALAAISGSAINTIGVRAFSAVRICTGASGGGGGSYSRDT